MAMYGEPQVKQRPLMTAEQQALLQCSTVGDTFPVGCEFSSKIVFGAESFSENPDTKHPVYRCVTSKDFAVGKYVKFIFCSTKFGMYKEHCGLDNLLMSWGHDGWS